MIDDLPPLREVIRRHQLSARKSLGQNFLLDLNLTARIARAGGPLDGMTVVEVGPGPGGLTRALIAEGAGRVVAIERDERAVAALGEIAAHYPGKIEIVAGDALTFDPRPLVGPGPVDRVSGGQRDGPVPGRLPPRRRGDHRQALDQPVRRRPGPGVGEGQVRRPAGVRDRRVHRPAAVARRPHG